MLLILQLVAFLVWLEHVLLVSTFTGQETVGSGGEGSVDLDGPGALASNQDVPLLGYGEHKERIFCFSKIFSGKGVNNFFDEHDEEDLKIQERNREFAEKLKAQKALPEERQGDCHIYS